MEVYCLIAAVVMLLIEDFPGNLLLCSMVCNSSVLIRSSQGSISGGRMRHEDQKMYKELRLPIPMTPSGSYYWITSKRMIAPVNKSRTIRLNIGRVPRYMPHEALMAIDSLRRLANGDCGKDEKIVNLRLIAAPLKHFQAQNPFAYECANLVFNIWVGYEKNRN